MADDPQVRDHDKFMLRLPPGLRERIMRVAKENRRSMNAEIVGVLTNHFPEPPTPEQLIREIRSIVPLSERKLSADRAKIISRALDNLRKVLETIPDSEE